MSEVVRVLRVIEYVGERAAVESQVARSLHGSKVFGTKTGWVSISVATVGVFPEVLGGLDSAGLNRLVQQNSVLASTLMDAGEVLDDLADVNDGGVTGPVPDKAMAVGVKIREILETWKQTT